MLKPEELQKIPYFSGLAKDSEASLELVRTTLVEHYTRGQVIFLEGELARGLYFLAEGQVRTFKSEPGGREQVLRLLKPGETWNEVAVLDGESNAASAQAIEDCIVWVIGGEVMLKVLETEPTVSRLVNRELAQRLRHMTELVAQISLKQVTARVARVLYDMVEGETILGVRVSNQITAQISHEQMASMAGTVREMVGRALKTLQKAGAIEARRGHIIILDPSRLERFL